MKILLVDDHSLFREGLKLLLGKLEIQSDTLDAGTLEEALQVARRHTDLDLVLFDLGLPDGHGMDALSRFRRLNDNLPVVVLSAMSDRATVVEALERGAMGFIPKTTRPEQLQRALRVVLSGGVYLPEAMGAAGPDAGHRFAGKPQPSNPLSALRLTERQLQVFRLIVQGRPNKLIARDLGVAESTIKAHVKPILKALNVTSRVGAILEVGRQGIVLD